MQQYVPSNDLVNAPRWRDYGSHYE